VEVQGDRFVMLGARPQGGETMEKGKTSPPVATHPETPDKPEDEEDLPF
jgi:hypothetical protein